MYQLGMLATAATQLDLMPDISKERLWESCKRDPRFRDYNQSSFTQTIFHWITSPKRYVWPIAIMYNAVTILQVFYSQPFKNQLPN